MIRYLKDRGTYVLFNTNGTLLTARKRARADRQPGSTSCACRSMPPSRRPSSWCAGATCSPASCATSAPSARCSAIWAPKAPRVSLWLTGLKETIDQLEDFVRLAHDIDVAEVYLQRLVYFPEGQGLARPESALFAGGDDAEGRLVRDAENLARELGIRFNASGATDPATSLKPAGRGAALVAVPAPVDADVFHRARPRAAVLHRAVLDARATTASRSATRPSKACARSGTARATRHFAVPC